MTTAVQVQYRRGTASQVAAFTGAQGEMVVDTTNQRLVVQDGATAGGWPADIAVRSAVANTNYSALVTDRIIAYTSISASRVVTLPASSAYPTGTVLKIVDESGSCSATNTITITPNGGDTINGYSSAVIANAYGFIALESSGAGKWTILASSAGSSARRQRSVTGSGSLPIVASDSILNINVSATLAITVPAASGRTGAPLTFKVLAGSTAGATLSPTGGDTFDLLTSLTLNPGQSVTLVPFNDGVNSGYAIE
jgi:hypothetical protein